MSLSARRAWIEIIRGSFLPGWGWSLSARRAWIEIKSGLWDRGCGRVALRKESVDRNIVLQKCTYVNMVALRKESVDRND